MAQLQINQSATQTKPYDVELARRYHSAVICESRDRKEPTIKEEFSLLLWNNISWLAYFSTFVKRELCHITHRYNIC
jgi:hypothetical protein